MSTYSVQTRIYNHGTYYKLYKKFLLCDFLRLLTLEMFYTNKVLSLKTFVENTHFKHLNGNSLLKAIWNVTGISYNNVCNFIKTAKG